MTQISANYSELAYKNQKTPAMQGDTAFRGGSNSQQISTSQPITSNHHPDTVEIYGNNNSKNQGKNQKTACQQVQNGY